MPFFNQTGPVGAGPMTGKGLGPCGRGSGFAMGRGRGFGRGLGRYFGWGVPQTKEGQLEDLTNYQKALKEELEDVEKEINNIK